MDFVIMGAGAGNVPPAHASPEHTVFLLEDVGAITNLDRDERHPFHTGQVTHVERRIGHQIRADHGAPTISVSGPRAADRVGLEAGGLLPKQPE